MPSLVPQLSVEHWRNVGRKNFILFPSPTAQLINWLTVRLTTVGTTNLVRGRGGLKQLHLIFSAGPAKGNISTTSCSKPRPTEGAVTGQIAARWFQAEERIFL